MVRSIEQRVIVERGDGLMGVVDEMGVRRPHVSGFVEVIGQLVRAERIVAFDDQRG